VRSPDIAPQEVKVEPGGDVDHRMDRFKRVSWLLLAVIVPLAFPSSARADDARALSANALASPSGNPAVPRWPRLRYESGALPPPGYHFESNPRKGLIVAGVLTFGVPYLVSVMIAGVSHNQADRWLFVPVTGPIGTLVSGNFNCNRDDNTACAGSVLSAVGLSFDLAAQTAGVLLFTMAYVFPKKEWVSDYEVGRAAPPALSWSVRPRVDGSGRVGLTVAGTFF
jgi:hypothetical protein